MFSVIHDQSRTSNNIVANTFQLLDKLKPIPFPFVHMLLLVSVMLLQLGASNALVTSTFKFAVWDEYMFAVWDHQ